MVPDPRSARIPGRMALPTEYQSVVKNTYRCRPDFSTFIDLGRGSNPRIRLILVVTDDNGVEQRRDIIGANPISFYLKTSPEDADPAPSYTYPGTITVVDAVNGVVDIQFSSADTVKPNKFWKLVVVKNAVPAVAGYGTLKIATM
jgi:hypothetical protein